MAIEPDKGPEKVPPPREQNQKPRFQQPPKKKFDDRQVRRDQYPPDKEVVKELKKRADKGADFARQPPQARPQAPPPQRQAQQEGMGYPGFGDALEEDLESVDQRPPPPQPQSSRDKQPKVKDKQKTEETAKKAPPPKEHKKEEKTAKGQQQAPQQPQVQAPQTGAAQQAGVGVTGHVAGAGTGTNIDQVINVFQSNPVFQSNVQSMAVQARGADTEIAVVMANGVNVNVTVMAGGKDLNVVIRGITAEAQAAIDNPANQAFLQSKLAEKGFVIHQMRTFRGEEPSKPAGEAGRREREETAGEGGPGDDEKEG